MTLSLGCDPGVFYRPRDWRHAGEYRWAATVDELDIEAGRVGGSISDPYLAPEFTVHNSSLAPVLFIAARLETAVGAFNASTSVRGKKRNTTIASGETKRVSFRFDFPKPLGEILIGAVSLTRSIQTGNEVKEIRIEFWKV